MSANSIKILLIEESLAEKQKLLKILVGTNEVKFKTVQQSSLEKALTFLEGKKCDLILLSLLTEDPKGSLTINKIREKAGPIIPIIILTDQNDEEFSTLANQMGAQECLIKNQTDPKLFCRILSNAVKLSRMKKELDEKSHQLALQTQIQEKYKKNNDLLQVIMEETTDTIFVKDDQGKYLLLNSTAARNFEKTPEELIGKTNKDLPIPASSIESMEESDRKVFQSGKAISYEVTLNGPNGPRTLFTTKSPFRDRHGKIIGLIGISRDITDQKSAEELLRSEHAYRKPIEEAMLAGVVAMQNITGKIIYVNPAFSKIVGWTEQELLGRTPPFPFWPPEEIENIFKILKGRLLMDKPPEIELLFQRKYGEKFPVLIKTAPLTDGRENKIGIVSTIADITNQKLSETRLRESHNLLKSIIEGTSDAIYLRDLEGRYLMINSSGARFLGKSPEEINGKKMSDLFSKELVQQFEELDKEVLRKGKIHTRENKLSINGADLTFLTTRGLIWNHENRVSGVFGISRDITEKKVAEEILRKSEERLAAVIDNSTAIIQMKDLEGKYLLINKKFEEHFHFSKKEIIGKTIYDVFPVEIADKLRANDQQVIKKKRPVEFDETVLQDGELHYYLSVRFPLLDDRGEVYAVCGISTDMTDRKVREEDQMKIEKLESLGLLAGGIAHDFNNILTAILGNISLCKSFTESKDKLLTRLNEAERATLRASELAQQLLTFSKGGAPIKKVVSIQSLIEHSAKFALTGSNVQSQLYFQEGLWPVEADEAQMNQVIQNLIINAKQAMPSGGTIRIEVNNQSIEEKVGQEMGLRKGNYLSIFIQDEGTGIPKEHLAKIFDPYFTTKSQGSGLGLSITHSIIKRHHGYITAESNPAGGTIFLIYLPASPLALLPQENIEKEAMPQGKGRVLVMDDEESILNLAGEILMHLGYEVDQVKNSTDAVQLYKNAHLALNPYDVVVTDLTIPGDIGGVETLRRLREIDPHVKVIVSSGYSNDPAMSEFKDFGFSDCLKKPYRAFEVSQTIKRVLKARRLED